MKKYLAAAAITISLFAATQAMAFNDMKQDCTKCHVLSKEDATMLMSALAPNIKVLEVNPSQLKGLWQVDIERQGRKNVVYIDYTKKLFMAGPMINFIDRKNYTQERITNITRVDPSLIPLDDAIVVGSQTAKNKVIVFSDPDCPYCAKLHQNIKEVIAKRPDVAFYVKMFPLPMHQGADVKSRSIICQKSLKALEDAYEKKEVPPPTCTTKAVEQNIELGNKLGVDGTPAMIFPDGKLVSGALDPQAIISNLGGSQ